MKMYRQLFLNHSQFYLATYIDRHGHKLYYAFISELAKTFDNVNIFIDEL